MQEKLREAIRRIEAEILEPGILFGKKDGFVEREREAATPQNETENSVYEITPSYSLRR